MKLSELVSSISPHQWDLVQRMGKLTLPSPWLQPESDAERLALEGLAEHRIAKRRRDNNPNHYTLTLAGAAIAAGFSAYLELLEEELAAEGS